MTQMTHLQKVYVLIDDYLDKFIQRQEFHKIMLREQLIEKDTIISGFIIELKKRNLSYIKKLIQDGQKSGEFKKNIDIVLMMTTMVGTVSQMITSQNVFTGEMQQPGTYERTGISEIHEKKIKRPFKEPF